MIRTVNAADLERLVSQARKSPRRRAHLNIHATLEDPVQRLYIALEPDTWIPPHRHDTPPKHECLVLIRGALDLLLFADDGTVRERLPLAPAGIVTVEVPAGIWHGYVVHDSGTVALEIKPGPYVPTAAADFAPWAPAEGDADAATCLQRLRTAEPGDNPFRPHAAAT